MDGQDRGDTDTGPTAQFPAGAARGVSEAGLNVFRGLPYALPPTGRRRWQPPASMPDWEGLRDATRFGPACPQPFRRSGSVYECDIPLKDEDCLNLNIWAPTGGKDLPVFVWIHGGNLLRGAGSEPLTEGAALARRGQVVVTINYRLNILGYLSHPELDAESADGVSGNYGLLDQIAALEWVQRNIAAVGGNPDNVTVAGESAGALSVYYLMCAPAAKGLFHRAIAQSGHICSAQALKTEVYGMGTGHETGKSIMAALGCQSIAALREWDPQNLALAADKAGFTAQGVVDGVVLPDQQLHLFQTGQTAQVPLIAGFNSGEILTLEFFMPPLPETAEDYEEMIRARYGSLADRFLARYPSDDIKGSTQAAVGEALFGWSALSAAKAQVKAGLPAYVYYFDHGYPEAQDRGLHGFHACELAYLFNTMAASPPAWPKAPDSVQEASFTRAFGDYWTGFTRDGVPTATGAPDWPDYSDSGAVMHFADTPRVARDLFGDMYAVIDADFARRRADGDRPWSWNAGVGAPVPSAD
ncbi:carboxylesterase/lipase family protein [Roseobacter sp. GAI101]|uniref:carboxylesterase/lipase family protein n=1 Tax=Roseobacter sp. (strain GAI101) TaxID=391589 RepID=UPI0018DC2D8B|nr:carboxylesterase family protein [Roseobacter sp. GAI101]